MSSAPFISNCDFDAENELLTHMLQRQINTAAATPTGNIYAFSQDQYAESLFGTAASTYSMDTTGYVYLPVACASNKVGCALLVVLHGCEQGYYASVTQPHSASHIAAMIEAGSSQTDNRSASPPPPSFSVASWPALLQPSLILTRRSRAD